MYFGLPFYGYDLNCNFCLFDNTWETSVIYDEAKFACFLYMQPQKVKFTSV